MARIGESDHACHETVQLGLGDEFYFRSRLT
jgi:hypothetical protein